MDITPSPPKEDPKVAKAKRRADTILDVRVKKKSPTAAAAELGVSRKTFYELEARGLTAMFEALMDKPPGRPKAPPPDPEKEAMECEIRELRAQVRKLQIRDKVRELLLALPQVLEPPRAPRRYAAASKKKPGEQRMS